MAELQELYTAIVEMQEETAMELTKTLLDEGVPAMDIFNRYQDALGEVGQRFEKQIYFIPELIMSGEMMKSAAEILKPHMAKEKKNENGGEKLGKVIMATVQGDIHDIGKNIATMMLELNGLDVRDLGVDVPTEKIIEEAKAFGANVIGLSGLLTLAFDPMKSVVDKLKDEGLRDDIKVLIGGGQMDEQVLRYVGADAFVTDAVEGVNYVKSWVG